MNLMSLNIDMIKPYERNPRKNKKAIDYVANSIEEFGFKVPIVIDKDYVIVTGHTRWLAAQKLGMTEVPCIMADDLTEEQVKAFRLADNKVSEFAEWDDALLALELMELAEFDVEKFGFELGLDDEDEKKDKNKNAKMVEAMEIKAFEHHDYLVFVFDNQMDWLNVVNKFGIKKVNAGYGETKKIGVGRVVHGKRLIEALRDKDSDTESGQE